MVREILDSQSTQKKRILMVHEILDSQSTKKIILMVREILD